MKKGISQYWTPGLEDNSQRAIAGAPDFATRFLRTSVRNALKYDQRSRAGKAARAELLASLAGATDDDLLALAKYEAWALHGKGVLTRDEVREEIIKIQIILAKKRAEACDRLAKLLLVVEAGRIVRERYHQ